MIETEPLKKKGMSSSKALKDCNTYASFGQVPIQKNTHSAEIMIVTQLPFGYGTPNFNCPQETQNGENDGSPTVDGGQSTQDGLWRKMYGGKS